MSSKEITSYEDMANDKELADQALRNFMTRDPPENPDPSTEESVPDVVDQIVGMDLGGDDSRDSTQAGSISDYTPASGKRARS